MSKTEMTDEWAEAIAACGLLTCGAVVSVFLIAMVIVGLVVTWGKIF